MCALGVTLHYVPLTLTFLAFLHLTFFSREFSLSQKLQNEKQPTSNGSVSVWGSNHTRKGCRVFHTEEGGGCFILGSLCSILRFLGEGKLARDQGKVLDRDN